MNDEMYVTRSWTQPKKGNPPFEFPKIYIVRVFFDIREEFSDSEEGPRDFLVTVRCSPKACLSNYRVFMAVMNQFYMPKMVR